ncbi:MAG: cytochrome c [Planctomycetes bacterium]|nr:cytochrome c [Planctomycetota bacterium]
MIRKFGAVLAGFAMVALCIAVDAADDKSPTTKEIMKTVFAKETGLCGKCVAAGKAEKWEDAQKLAKTMAECGAALPKNKCPKGDADSWAKLTKEFAEQTEAISKAAEAKDAVKFAAAVKTFTGSCKACHDAHKAPKK